MSVSTGQLLYHPCSHWPYVPRAVDRRVRNTNQMASSLQSNPLMSPIECHGVSSDRRERDISSNKKESSRGDDDASRSSKSEALAGPPPAGSNGTNGMNITDFFSSEVFQIVIRNPTTAHRFLKFCQSRVCGENMEFLQKVIYDFCPSSPSNLTWLSGRCI